MLSSEVHFPLLFARPLHLPAKLDAILHILECLCLRRSAPEVVASGLVEKIQDNLLLCDSRFGNSNLRPEMMITTILNVFVLQSLSSHWTTYSTSDPTLSLPKSSRRLISFDGCDMSHCSR
jgi:hypothetical protein